LDALPSGGLWDGEPNAISNAIGYAKRRSRSDDAVIRIYDEAGDVIETHEHTGEKISYAHRARLIFSWRTRDPRVGYPTCRGILIPSSFQPRRDYLAS